jgi:hypothetical protein
MVKKKKINSLVYSNLDSLSTTLSKTILVRIINGYFSVFTLTPASLNLCYCWGLKCHTHPYTHFNETHLLKAWSSAWCY